MSGKKIDIGEVEQRINLVLRGVGEDRGPLKSCAHKTFERSVIGGGKDDKKDLEVGEWQ